DLVLINTASVGGPAGRRAGALDRQLAVRGPEGPYRDFVKPGTRFEIVLTDEGAAAIRDQVRSGNLVGGDYPAIVKFKITKEPRGFVGVVDSMALLIYSVPRHYFN